MRTAIGIALYIIAAFLSLGAVLFACTMLAAPRGPMRRLLCVLFAADAAIIIVLVAAGKALT